MFEACANGRADDDRKRRATVHVTNPWLFPVHLRLIATHSEL